ncbi:MULTISPECIES: hypothetical protein [unclassified Nocardiopsis]|uniref:hypothetical protein n=1 Tax=unclassified Nocardiopsis TaxID=2649073 RepID=UPI0011610DC7|nr:hypothetical protein [Nocardiopsis sp. TSRI0078]
MKYNCSVATHTALRAAVASLSIATRRWGVDDSRTVGARKEWERLRALALLETAEEFFPALSDDDRQRFTDKLNNNQEN